MQFAKVSKVLAGVAVLVLTSAVVASADVNDKKTTLKVKETIEVPGAVLQPGEYVVKLVESPANKHIVQFLNKEENKVLSTVIAIPNLRLKPTGKTEFAWYETPAGQPPVLKAWFYPGDNFGQEFAYPEGRATELAAATHQQVPHITDDEAAQTAKQGREMQETVIVAEAPAPTPKPQTQSTAPQAAQRERDMQAQRDRAQIAQAQTPRNQQRNPDRNLTAQQTTPRNQQRDQLPQTAGFGALLALLGLGSLGASRAVRKLRNK